MIVGIDIRELERGAMTGIGRFLRNFIAYAAQERPQHRFLLYGNQHTDTDFAGDNVTVRIRREGLTQWWDQGVLPKMANGDGVEVFFSPYIKGPIRVRCPLVVTIHDLMDLVFPEYGGGRVATLLFKTMARQVGRRADLVLADSEYSAADIARLLGLDKGKIQVMPIGLEERYRPIEDAGELESVRRRYGLDEPYIYCLSNFKPHKNIHSLIEAYARLQPETRARFALALGGREDRWRPEREALAKRLGVGERVRFIGQVEEEDMPALYSGATLFAFPSIYEGFGLPPLEAMACGTPVLCSDRASLPEVVGEGGRLIDPEDIDSFAGELAALLESPEQAERWRQAGLAQASSFRADAICERQMRVLEAVAERGRR